MLFFLIAVVLCQVTTTRAFSPHSQQNIHSAMTTYCYAELEDVNLPLPDHRDLTISPSASVSDCAKLCVTVTECSAFTWMRNGRGTGTCVLKPAYGNGAVTPGAV
jgi:hypothetical protein